MFFNSFQIVWLSAFLQRYFHLNVLVVPLNVPLLVFKTSLTHIEQFIRLKKQDYLKKTFPKSHIKEQT